MCFSADKMELTTNNLFKMLARR